MVRQRSAARVDEWLARYVPPILLALVAAMQIYLADVRDLLTPARGGGFGLFSTVDKLRHRQLRVYWTGPSGEARISLPGTAPILKGIKETAALPSDAKLRALAELAHRVGRPVSVEGEPPFPFVRVEVWKRAFDQDTLEASRVKVRELTIERP